MGSLSDYTENALLDHLTGETSYTQPTNLYVALSTADPLDSGSGLTEPSGNGYARELINNWDSASSRTIQNTDIISFTEATGSWGVLTHFAILDNSSGGNMIAHGSLSISQTIADGDNASFQAGDIDVSWQAGGLSNYAANATLDHVFKNTIFTFPTSVYIALTTVNVTDSMTGSTITEPGDTYARVDKVGAFDVASGGSTSNTAEIAYVTATGSWGTLIHVALCDALTAGNILLHSSLTLSKAIGVSDTAKFAASGLTITIT